MSVRTWSVSAAESMSCQAVSRWSVPAPVSLAPLVTYLADVRGNGSSSGPTPMACRGRASTWVPQRRASSPTAATVGGADHDPVRGRSYGVGKP